MAGRSCPPPPQDCGRDPEQGREMEPGRQGSRILHTKNDTEKVDAWRLVLNRIHRILDVALFGVRQRRLEHP